MKVYLAGGLRNNWHDKARATVDPEWLDPRTLNVEGASLHDIAMQEVDWLRECDLVFAYLERDNPSGLGMSAEIGFAHALDKPIIFVDERNDQYSAFLHHFCVRTTTDFDEGLGYLQAWIELRMSEPWEEDEEC